ncbi:arylesterase [Rhodobacteraceae bacterium KMM 6894]|nr:arylesterase [Rhodobacteraceae bacterium KMM 6894]
MTMRLIIKGLVRYGLWASGGKAMAVILLTLGLFVPRAEAQDLRILALGDSLTQGYGLVQGDGLVPQLAQWLQAHGTPDDAPVRLINGGVSGSTTAGGAARVAWALEGGAEAMIVALGGNDLLRGIDPNVSRANLEKILKEAAMRDVPVLLVGLRAPGNYGADFQTAFEGMYVDLAQAYDTLLWVDMFEPFPLDPGARAVFFQADGIHPNATGVARIVEVLGPHVQALIARAQ